MDKSRIKIDLRKILILALSIIILVLSIILKVSMLLTGAIIVWMILLIYTITNIGEHIALFFYLVSFFVFLFGREICYSYFGLERYYTYLEPYNEITFFLLLISLGFIWFGYMYAGSRHKLSIYLVKRFGYGKERRQYKEGKSDTDTFADYSRTSKYVFYICYTASVITVLIQASYIKNIGYLASYTGSIEENNVPIFLSYMSAFLGTAVCLYLAAEPSKKSAVCALILYEIYGILTLLTGHRYAFIAISMTVVIYVCIRNRKEGGWITKKHIAMGLVMIPVLVVSMLALDTVRVGGEFVFEGWRKAVISFLDQQGGSINVIKRIFYYKNEVADLFAVSLDNLRSILFENALVRNVFDIKVYTGNSAEHALYGHSLAHRLSYLEYGEQYLKGHGVGSCYIAELYHDLGIIGVMAGNFFYGYILKKIDDIQFVHCFRDGILLSMIYYLILAPRGNFDGFIGGIFSLYSIFAFILIWMISRFFSWRRLR